jgi:hypothetical protein
MKKLLLFSVLAVTPLFAQSTLEDWVCDAATATSSGLLTELACNTPHNFGNGVRSWVNLAFLRIPLTTDTLTLNGTTYTWASSLAGCSANTILIDPKYVVNNMAFFQQAVNGDTTGSGLTYCASTTANATMDTVPFNSTSGSPGSGNMYVRALTGGTAGQGLTVSTNDTSTFTVDASSSSTTAIRWYVQIYGATGNWAPLNTAQNVNSAKQFLMQDMTSSSTSMILTDTARIEPGNNCVIGFSFNSFGATNAAATPQECVTVGTPGAGVCSGNNNCVPLTARGVSCGGATVAANPHYAGDYSPNPNTETSTGVEVACSITGRPGAWIAQYVDGSHFTVPLNSSSFGGSASVRIERSGAITSPTSNAITYPMFTEHGNESGYIETLSGGFAHITWPTSAGVGGCIDSSVQGLINCRSTWSPPFTAYYGQALPYIPISSVTVSGGIGTVTLTGPYNETGTNISGNSYQCSTTGYPACVNGCGGNGTLCSYNIWLNRLFWLQGMQSQVMNTYFVICDNTNLAACSSGSITRNGSTPPQVTSWKFLCQLRDGTTCADGTYLNYAGMGVATAKYVSGGTISGLGPATNVTAKNCTVTVTNGGGSGATAIVTLTSNNTIATNTVMGITATGGSFTSAPTAATFSNGVAPNAATCSGSIVMSSTLSVASAIPLVNPEIVRFGMDYQAPSVPNAWGSGQGNNTKDTIPAANVNHLRVYVQSGGSEQRRLDGAYTTGSFGTFSQSSWETVWNSQSQIMPINGVFSGGGSNNLHYYYEPSCDRYAGQWLLNDVNMTPHTQVSGSGAENWPNDPIYNGHTYATYQPYAPNGLETAHTLYNMYGWYDDNGGFRENYNGTLTQGTQLVGPIKLYLVTGEPEEMVHVKVSMWAPSLYGTSNPGYEACWGGPKEIDASRWAYQISYSTSDLKTIGFSNGTSGGSVAPQNNSTSEYQVWYSPTMSINPIEYIGIRPVAAIQGCSLAGVSPIWCQLQTYQGPGVDPMYSAVGDHVTVAGVTGNTAANQTAAATAALQPRVIWWRNDPRWAYQSSAVASNPATTDEINIKIANCCSAGPWGFHTGDTIATSATAIATLTGYTITVVDDDDFIYNGLSWSTLCASGGCSGGYTRKLVPPATNALTSIVATGGCTSGGGGTCSAESCQANLSNDPVGQYAGEELTVAFGTNLHLGGSAPENFLITGQSHTSPYSLTFGCPNVPDGTYNTEQNLGTGRLAVITWPAFALSGTGTSGSYTSTTGGTVVATDNTRNFSEIEFAVPGGCSITSPSPLPTAELTIAYSQALTDLSCGSGPFTWTVSVGSLPTGLTLGSSTGIISGTPTGSPGLTSFTVQVTDGGSNTATLTTSITVVAAVSITTSSPLTAGEVSVPYTQSVSASGGSAPLVWSISSGSLPAGLSFSSGGVVSGTPTTIGGPTTFVALVTDALGATATKSIAMTIIAGPTINTSSPLPGGTTTIAYSQSFSTSSGTTPYTWAVTGGALPTGLTLSSGGLLSGTPTVACVCTFTVKVTDAVGGTSTASFSLTISLYAGPPIVISPTSITGAPCTVGASCSVQMSATGGVGSYTWSISAGPIPGMTMNASTGLYGGSPTVPGTYNFTVGCTDTVPQTQTQVLTIVVLGGAVFSGVVGH